MSKAAKARSIWSKTMVEDGRNLYGSLAEEAYEKLKSKIIHLEFKPGEKIQDQQVAPQLGMSRTPIREALTKLERDGFLQKIPRYGYLVRMFSLKEMEELYDLRILLESYALGLAIKKASDEEISGLGEVLNEGEKLLEQGKIKEFTEKGLQFHLTVAKLGGNATLDRMMASLAEKSIWIGRFSYKRTSRSGESFEEHRKIFEHFKARNAKAAVRALEDHLSNAKKNFIELGLKSHEMVFLY